MSELIRNLADLPSASRAELEAVIREFAGGRAEPRESDDALRVRASMALLSATDATGHLGVNKGERPLPHTLKELSIMAKKKQSDHPDGTVAAELSAKRTKKPITPPTPVARKRMVRVRATGTGTSKLQEGSIRAAVLAKVPSRKSGILVEELDAECGVMTRPHLLKLLEKGHVEIVE